MGEMVQYEMHVGTFTPEGTFESAIPRLTDLAELGVNTIQLMPVAQFSGNRNWGYDGVYPFAPQNSYGGPVGLKRFVDACHGLGLNVLLDVVYNHWGPEGNYLAQFGPYFTEEYRIPWGSAVNLDGPWSDGVREYLIANMAHWFENYRMDGLRVDAIHAMFDKGAVPFWHLAQERLGEIERRLGRKLLLIAESDLNSPKVVLPPETGGLGFDAQWLDDFHHIVYVLLDKNGHTHYEDFGSMEQLAKAYREGFVHSGEYVRFRKRKHGASSAGLPGDRFVAFVQNHDQAGNRVRGERLSVLVDFERLKLGAAALLLAPYVPLLFMGEEYGEDAPFFFFADFSDPELMRAYREGRKTQFAAFHWGGGEPPDPFDPATREASVLRWDKRHAGRHRVLRRWHKTLIALRARPALGERRPGAAAPERGGKRGAVVPFQFLRARDPLSGAGPRRGRRGMDP
jgi:maltooligosyltrehalose trehalohydrolase